MYRRKNRKACINDKGITNFEFDYHEEIAIYKFVMGYRLSKSEYNGIKENKRYDNYIDWKKSVKKKCNAMSLIDLKEFNKYLSCVNLRKKKDNNLQEKVSMLLITSVISYWIGSLEINKSVPKLSFVSTAVIVIIILIIFLLYVLILYKLLEPFYSIDSIFLADYIKIVEKVLDKKNRKMKEKQGGNAIKLTVR